MANTTITAGATSNAIVNGTTLQLSTADHSAYGTLRGGNIAAIQAMAGDVVNLTGLISTTKITGNAFSNHGLLTVAINNGGVGYTVGDVLTVTGGGGVGGTVMVDTVSGGVITSISVVNPGSGYTVGTNLSTTGGTGTGATIDLITRGSGGITNANGHISQGITANGTFTTGSITTATAIQVIDNDVGSGPDVITTAIGMDVKPLTKATSTNIGVRIALPTTATNNYALQFITGVGGSPTTASNGITWGTDVNLYRSAANTLRTDTSFTTPLDVSSRHFLNNGATPTLVFGTGAGTGPTLTSITGTDGGMQISIITGTAPAANVIFTVTFAVAYPTAVNAVVFSATSSTAAALNGANHPYISAQSAATFTFRSGSTALAANTSYSWNFTVRGS